MKRPVEQNNLSSKFFCLSPGLLYQQIRRDTGRRANEAFSSSVIAALKQEL